MTAPYSIRKFWVLAPLLGLGVIAASCPHSRLREPSPALAVQQDPCTQEEGTVVSTTKWEASVFGKTLRVNAPSSGSLCLEVKLTQQGVAKGEPAAAGLPVFPTIRLSDGTTLAAPSEERRAGAPWRATVPTQGGATELRLEGLAEPVSIDVRYVVAEIRERLVPAAPVTCTGQLQGFEHPLRESESERVAGGFPAIKRGGMLVQCRIKLRNSVPDELIGVGVSNDQGGYDIVVAPQTVQSLFPEPFVQSVSVTCASPACGNEDFSLAQTGFSDTGDLPEEIQGLNVRRVLDLSVQGEWDRNGDGTLERGPLLGARLVSMATSDAERNDRPFVLHEQTDLFNEEGTSFLAWGINGQLASVDLETLLDEPCELEDAQLCILERDSCNTTKCGTDGFACPGAPLLRAMLRQGYDVWLVDTLDGTADILRVAAAAPALYSKILAYPASAAPTLASDAASVPVSIGRAGAVPLQKWMVVAGYSTGGVVARAGLLMWERASELPLPGFVDYNGVPITLGPEIGDLPPISDHVKLYLSIDAPHTGVRVPPALQGYIRRVADAVERTTDFGEASEFAARGITELDAVPARQLLRERVEDSDELGCWDLSGSGRPEISDCTVHRAEPSLQITNEESAAFLASLEALDRGVDRDEDGLPEREILRSVAYSNGSAANQANAFREVDTTKVLNVKFDIRRFGGAFDKNHKLRDEDPPLDSGGSPPDLDYQPAGAQWNTSCQRIGAFNINLTVGVPWGDICKRGDSYGLTCVWTTLTGPFNGFKVKLKDVEPTFTMSSANGGKGFPTLITTQSALLQGSRGADPNAGGGWYDATWQDSDKFHTNVDERLCQFAMYYADDALLGDADGAPACRDGGTRLGTFSGSCLTGARSPGRKRIESEGQFGPNSEELCDPSEVPRPRGLNPSVLTIEEPIVL